MNHLEYIIYFRFVCNICGKKVARSGDLTVHKRIHTNERPYQCSLCSKRYKMSCHLKAYIVLHSGMFYDFNSKIILIKIRFFFQENKIFLVIFVIRNSQKIDSFRNIEINTMVLNVISAKGVNTVSVISRH